MFALNLSFFLSSHLIPFLLNKQCCSFFFFFLFFFTLLSFSILISYLYRRRKLFDKTEQPSSKSIINCSLPNLVDKTQQTHKSNLTHLTHSLLVEILPSNPPKWASLFDGEEEGDEPGRNGLDMDKAMVDSGGEECGKKKKKRVRKKRPSSPNSKEEIERDRVKKEKQELVCLYPFTSSSSATQRKIKQQYDQLVKSHESNGLTLAEVGHFVNVLIEARNELQHKSGVIQRKFTITKALLFKADRSSFDRLRQQIYKLELEQKRLEEDAFVYNRLQQQLKLSPAYKKMLEIGTCMELKAKTGKLEDSVDTDFADISFEELLAQEKKDYSFWQKNGKPRSCAGR